jgi:hypothetical protein
MSNTDHTVSAVPYDKQIVQNIRPALLALADRRPTMALLARTLLEPEQLAASIRQAVRGIDPDIPVYAIQTMDLPGRRATHVDPVIALRDE